MTTITSCLSTRGSDNSEATGQLCPKESDSDNLAMDLPRLERAQLGHKEIRVT